MSAKRNSHFLKLSIYSSWLFLSAFTKEVPGLGGAIYADLVGLIIVTGGVFSFFRSRKQKFPPSIKIYMAWLVILLFSCFLNTDLEGWIEEYIKLVYIYCVFLSLYLIGTNLSPSEFRDYCLVSCVVFFILALSFLIDFVVFPFLGNGNYGGLVGGFRNTGQAGTFFSIAFILCLSIGFAGAFNRKYFICIICLVVFVALVATSKRAALIGVLMSGVVLYIIGSGRSSSGFLKRSAISVFVCCLVFFVFNAFSEWGVSNIDGLERRIEKKFVEDFDGSSQVFLSDQVYKTLEILVDNPFFGAGASGSIGFLGSRYEVHNGYLKVFAISGLIGGVTYLLYLFFLFKEIYRARKLAIAHRYYGFVGLVFPLFVGYSVAWAYTFPLRKREFWLLLAFIYVFINIEKKIGVTDSGERK